MDIIYESGYSIFYEKRGSTTLSIIEEAYVIIDIDGLEITHLNAVEGVPYTATPREEYVNPEVRKAKLKLILSDKEPVVDIMTEEELAQYRDEQLEYKTIIGL